MGRLRTTTRHYCGVTPLDFAIVVFALLFGLVGIARGFLIGALSLAGFVAGAWLATRFGPDLLGVDNTSPYAPLFGLVGAVVAGTILSAGAEGIAGRARNSIRIPGFGFIDGLLGFALSVALSLGLAWVVSVIVLQTPGARAWRKEVQRSEILTRLNAALPSDSLLKALARFDKFPSIDGPDVDVGRPRAAVARDPEVRQAASSVVRILGTACGLGVQGSGWIAGDGIVVTNAHVVAGQDDTSVQLEGEGERLDAEAIWFDVKNDVALLRVAGLSGVPKLQRNEGAGAGTSAAVLGFPENGPYDVRPGRLGQTENVVSQDAYGRGPIRRRITALRGLVRSGNSGGPMVDGQGRVVTTIFAATRGSPSRSGFGVPDAIVREALSRAGDTVDTGPCA